MIVKDVGILGTGLWDGPAIGNEHFGEAIDTRTEVRDPFKGRRADDGTVSIAGLEFSPDKHPRTLAAIERAFLDPYRGARRRRFFPRDMRVSDAETEAARKALADAGLQPSDVGALLVQSFLPDEIQPKNGGRIAFNLGITNAPSWELDSICNSAVTHWTVGSSLVASGAARHVLCVQSVAYSRVSDPGSSSAVQEADLASAFVIGPSPGSSMAFSWRTDGRLHSATTLQWSPQTGDTPRRYWERSKEALFIRFDQAQQSQVMADLRRYAPVVCAEALARAEMRMEEIDVFISHQPMVWHRAFIEEVLGLREGVAFDTFEEYANVNSCSIPASLHHARLASRVPRGAKVLVFGPAAGYTYAAAALRW